MYGECIAKCARNFGSPPRWLQQYPTDRLRTTFDYYSKVRNEGIVVWGQMIQANWMIYKPGKQDTGGEFLYSLDAATPPPPVSLLAQGNGEMVDREPAGLTAAFSQDCNALFAAIMKSIRDTRKLISVSRLPPGYLGRRNDP
jgi:hypothetical protein